MLKIVFNKDETLSSIPASPKYFLASLSMCFLTCKVKMMIVSGVVSSLCKMVHRMCLLKFSVHSKSLVNGDIVCKANTNILVFC